MMKVSGFLPGLLFVVGACAPEPAPQAPAYQSTSKQCATIAALGAVIMAARQTGRTQADTVRSLDIGEDEGLTRISRTLAQQAYREPIRSTRRAQKEAVRQFTSSTTILCQRARQRTLGRR